MCIRALNYLSSFAPRVENLKKNGLKLVALTGAVAYAAYHPFQTLATGAAFIAIRYCSKLWSANDPSQSFKARVEKAKAAIWGASYFEEDYRRLKILDPNYVGIGRSYEAPQVFQLDENPLDANWHEESFWEEIQKLDKKFESIYIDRGTQHHIYSRETTTEHFEKNLGRMLAADGKFYLYKPINTDHRAYLRIIDFLKANHFKKLEGTHSEYEEWEREEDFRASPTLNQTLKH